MDSLIFLLGYTGRYVGQRPSPHDKWELFGSVLMVGLVLGLMLIGFVKQRRR